MLLKGKPIFSSDIIYWVNVNILVHGLMLDFVDGEFVRSCWSCSLPLCTDRILMTSNLCIL